MEIHMTIKLNENAEAYLLTSIRRFFAEEMDDEIGDLKAIRVLDFCIREVAPSAYNQAIADAQTFFRDRVTDLGGVQYEAEFDYWKRR
jgi:uncharacterized protein (DUF2164 family)